MNIIITLLFAPLMVYLLRLKINEEIEHGSFIALLITPVITIISLGISIYGFGLNTSVAGFFIVLFIIFSLVGDVFNSLKEDYLLYGLIFFAIGHIFLIVSSIILCSINIITTLTIILTGLGAGILYTKFKPKLEGIMEIAVPIYILLASLSLIFSITSGSLFFTFGVILFYLSDVMLGMKLFWKTEEEDFESYDWLSKRVWPLYGTSIYFIANSLLF